MQIKIEIIADDVKELLKKLSGTFVDLCLDVEFCERIQKKKIESSFFTNYSTITKVEKFKNNK